MSLHFFKIRKERSVISTKGAVSLPGTRRFFALGRSVLLPVRSSPHIRLLLGTKTAIHALLVTRGSQACVHLQHTWILGTHGSWAHIHLWHMWISGTRGFRHTRLSGTRGSQAHTDLWHTWISWAHVDLSGNMDLSLAPVDLRHTQISLRHTWISLGHM